MSTRIYGKKGYCQLCRRKRVRIHCHILKKLACMRCYARQRMKDPKYRALHAKRMRAIRARRRLAKARV